MKLKKPCKNVMSSIKICQVYDKCKLSLETKITDILYKDQHMAHLQEILQEDVQYIQKMEVINEEYVKTWVGQASVSNYILEDVCRYSPEKVTHVETQFAMHEVNVQMLEPINYKTIVEEANTWGEYISSLAGPT